MSYRENSRFVHRFNSTNQNHSVRGAKRPLAHVQQPYRPSTTAPNYQPSLPSHPLGINQNYFGYGGGGTMMGISYGQSNESYEPEKKVFCNDSEKIPEIPKSMVGMMDSVFNKISQKCNVGMDNVQQSKAQPAASSTASFITSPSHKSDFNFVKPSKPVPNVKPVLKEPTKVAISQKPEKVSPQKHVSAKDMWEISYKKEVKKEAAKGYTFASNSSDTLVKNSNDEIIDIVPITEDTDFIFEGVPHYYKEKCQDKLTIKDCMICKNHFNTALQAKKHYRSGRHKSRLSSFLVSALEPGEGFDVSPETSIEIVPKANKTPDLADGEIFCTLCSLQLASKEAAQSHFQGKNHKKKVKEFLGIHPDVINVPLKDPKTLPTNTPPCISWDEPPESGYCNTVRMCILCSVKASSLISSKDHYAGKSHKKKIRLAKHSSLPTVKKFKITNFVPGGTLSMETNRMLYEQYIKACNNQANNNSIFGAEATWLRPTYQGKYANCVTPSGKYYCTICNLTLDTQDMLRQHEKTKEHKIAKSRQKSVYQ